MTVTVTKLKRAFEEMLVGYGLFPEERAAVERFVGSPTALTILAEKLSERPNRFPDGMPKPTVHVNVQITPAREHNPLDMMIEHGARCARGEGWRD